MSTQAVISPGYHRPDLAVKLEILRSRFGYSEAKAASLFGKTMTLAVVRGGELQIAEGRLERSVGSYAKFFPKGHRTADDTWDTRGIIGHTAGYGHTPVMTRNALAEFASITVQSVRFYLTIREQSAQQDAARQTAADIARICSSMQAEQAERQAADARILALLDAPEVIHALAA